MMYFAFGSNMDIEQMRKRCPRACAMGTAVLPNHQLAFGGYSSRWGGAVATVVPALKARVFGLLYSIDAKDLDALDAFEGVPYCYVRDKLTVVRDRRRRQQAHVYRLRSAKPAHPSPEYLALILEAYRRWDLDALPLLRAALDCTGARTSMPRAARTTAEQLHLEDVQ